MVHRVWKEPWPRIPRTCSTPHRHHCKYDEQTWLLVWSLIDLALLPCDPSAKLHVAVLSVERMLHHSHRTAASLFFPSSFVDFLRFHPRPVFPPWNEALHAMCQRPVGTNP
jgi:hypothetical protein